MKSKLTIAIETLSHQINQYEKRILKSSKLAEFSETQIHYIDAIFHLKNPTISEIANRFKVSKPSVSVHIDNLEKAGVVEKHKSDADKRLSHVHLTSHGLQLARLHDEIHEQFTEQAICQLSDQEIEQLYYLLQKIL